MSFGLRSTSIGFRLILIVLIAVTVTLLATADRLAKRSTEIYSARMGQVRTAVEAGYSVAADYAARADRGELSLEEAQAKAKHALGAIRYGEGLYLFALDHDVVMVFNPATPESVGTNRSGNKDSNGKLFSIEIVKTAKEQGDGIVEYLFPKPGGKEPIVKHVVVKDFKPWGWAICSGVYLDDVQRAIRAEMIEQGLIGLASLIVMTLACLAISRTISRPLADLTAVMRRIAGGDLGAEVPRDQGRQIGAMQEAVQVFKDNAAEISRLTERQREADEKAEQERRRMLLDLAAELDRSVSGAVAEISDASGRMHRAAENMVDNANHTSRNLTDMAAACDESSSSVGTAAAATEELHASISEISRQIHHSAEISRQAVTTAGEADAIVVELSEEARKIGDIVGLIEDIASQTNLLALNATIEAARAGEAGKGFAVVAGEVKHLAAQTGRATGEIAQQVASVQARTGQAVEALRGIGGIIVEISKIASAIASAVEEQGAATNEISRNAQRAAGSTQAVSRTVADVLGTASDTGQAAAGVAAQSEKLAQRAIALRDSVDRLLAGIKAQ